MVWRKKCGFIFFLLCGWVTLLMSAGVASAEGNDSDLARDSRVMVLHSYHYGFSWSDSISEGIRSEFLEEAKEVEVKFEFLDTRFNSSETYLHTIRKTIEAKYTNHKVDVIIACDDHALNFMLSHGRLVFPGVPVVFCSVSGFEPEMRKKLKLTGLRESIDIRATVETALRLHPATEEIAVILDRSRTGRALKRNAESVFSEFVDRPIIRYLENLTLDQLERRLSKLPKNTIVLLFIFRPGETGRVLSHEKNLERLRPHCPFPIYAVWQFYLGHGIVGGRLTNGSKEGRMAARMALRILKGENATDIPLEVSPVKYMFDYAELRRFGIDPELLPKDSILINKPSSFYETHKRLIWQIVLVFCLLLLALLGVTFGLMNTRRAERTLRRHEEGLRTTLNSIGDAVIATDTDGVITRMNPGAEKLTGWTLEEARGKRLGDVFRIINAQTRQPAADPVSSVIESGKIVGLANHTVLIGKEKVEYQIADSAAPIRSTDGSITGVVLVFRDVTEDYRMRMELRESEERFRDLFEMLPEAVFETDMNFELTFVNRRAFEMFGYSNEDLIRGLNGLEFLIPEDRDRAMANFARRLKGEAIGTIEYRALRKDGATFPILYHASPIMKSNELFGVRGVIVDITEHKRSEEARRESEERYRRIFENSVVGFFQSTPEGRFIIVNKAFARMLHYESPDDLVSSITDIGTHYYVDPEDGHRFQQILKQEGRVDGFVSKVQCKNGAQIWVSSSTRAYFDENGKVVRYEGVVSDITEGKRAQELTQIRMRLLEFATVPSLEELLRKILDEAERLVDSAIGFYHFVDPDQKTLSLQTWSTATLERFCKAESKGLHYDISQAGVWVDCIRQRRPLIHNDYASLPHRKGLPEGHATVIRELVVPIFREDRIVAILGVGNKPQDYTGQDVEIVSYLADVAYEIVQAKRAEEEQKKLQDQLFQAQKFEAIGTLAGGIAHDFNNLLMGIQGRASLISFDLEPSHPLSEHINAIEEYVRGATDLTKQLLGFARGGKYEVRTIDINELLLESATMFGRTKKEIRIHIKLQDPSPVVAADRGQIEQVLLNLYVNAWQAMPYGGELYLETKNVTLDEADCMPYQAEPGRYAKISVMDTGIGMDDSVRKRIFDPFFTTKEKSRGTGLGLASAYGIVKNHSGIITVDSKVGQGSTFHIYLPISSEKVHREKAQEEKLVKGSGTILIVDDEKLIIDVGQKMLEKLGYTVLIAASGKKAVETITEKGDDIDLVILDLVMPGMDGGTAFDIIREIQPKMPMILSSGYSIEGQAADIMRRGCNGFIQKPFNLSELSQQVRKVLDKVNQSDQ